MPSGEPRRRPRPASSRSCVPAGRAARADRPAPGPAARPGRTPRRCGHGPPPGPPPSQPPRPRGHRSASAHAATSPQPIPAATRTSAVAVLKAENDVRTTLVQTVGGLALASGAIVTYRTFRHTRLEQDRAYKLSQSQQVTESYAKAVEQLGHDQAPVRLGAMYSLERLAQDNPPRRQTIVDVLCAYLRMPYTPSSH